MIDSADSDGPDDDDDDLVAEEAAKDHSDGGDPDESTKTPDSSSNEASVGAAGLRDMPTDQDELGFGIYVESVAAFLTHKDTKPPLTMSIEGAWGCGKSSFMSQLANEIEKTTKEAPDCPRIIKFNAWRLDKGESLWAAFALSVTKDLRKKLDFFGRLRADIKLRWLRTDWSRGWFSFVRFTLVCLFLGYTGIAMVGYLSSHLTSINPFTEAVRAPSQPATTAKSGATGQSSSQSPGVANRNP
ncbi:KAP-like P-loop domain-containing protein [Edaphobacter modestus]|uniref:KAP-like P-loop domain-containing protein n=1 Tax=Edaphobacter modestus TaxID=388466 RepID=A0A4Q7YQT8_9BACT|nr:P-loop NTPase fold protein [Edaphobacter modestus]RZU40037.1 KAP-like P-loop domain-containing protein [Edaphobacter modestus]